MGTTRSRIVSLRPQLGFAMVLSAALAVLGCRPTVTETWAICARIGAPAIDECSGIVRSRQHPGILWVHNDSGDEPRFFAVDLQGRLLREVQVQGARNVDWEDIAVDDAGQIYLGDFGNNRNQRRDLVVYVVDEPDPAAGAPGEPLRIPVKRRLPFRFPEQVAFPDPSRMNFDCEAMYWKSGALHLLTKHRSDIRTVLYRLDPQAEGEQAAQKLGEFEIGSPVTAADLSPDGRLLAVLSYQYIHLFECTPERADDLAGVAHPVVIEGRQCEAVCFDGRRILFTNEQREIHCIGVDWLRTHDTYLPEPPVVEIPRVVPSLDGQPGEWRRAGGSGRLRFDRYVQRQPNGGPWVPEPEVRVGWSRDGLLLYARWHTGAPGGGETSGGEPSLYVMFGPGTTGEPRLDPAQRVWEATLEGDSLRLRARSPQNGSVPSAWSHQAGGAVVLEALLPGPDTFLGSGGEIRLNVLVMAQAGGMGSAEFGWSASLDMQPLENPLLWGHGLLKAR